MGKRKRTNKDIRRKIRRLERRLDRHPSPSDTDERWDSESSLSSNYGIQSVVSIPLEVNSVPDLADTAPAQSNDGCSTTPETPALADDILEALGVSKVKVESFAPKIREEISERWGQIIINGLSKEALQSLTEKNLIPENFKLLKAPALNNEMAAVLSDSTKNRDKRLEKAQNHLGIGIAAITNLMSTLIDGELEKKEIIKKLSEVGQVLLDLHCQNTSARRKLIAFSLDKKFVPLIQGVKRDSLLFGENLADKIKANKNAERSGLQIKRTFEPQPSTSHRTNHPAGRQGNLRGPPRPPAHRGKRGGQRYPPTSQNHAYRRPPLAVTDLNSAPAKTNNNKPPHKN